MSESVETPTLAVGRRILLWDNQVRGRHLDTGFSWYAVPGWYEVESLTPYGSAIIKSEASGRRFEGPVKDMLAVDAINQDYLAGGHIQL